MAEFLTPLDLRIIDDNTNRLLADFIYASDHPQVGVVVAPAGRVTDLASVPRLPLAFLLTGGKAKWAAVIHDELYRQRKVPRAVADAVFHEAMLVSGQAKWRADLMWAGVRAGGWRYWNSEDYRAKVAQRVIAAQVEADGLYFGPTR